MSDNNKCAQLKIEDLFSSSRNTLGDLFVLQKDIQESVYGYDFEKMRERLGNLKEFIDMNYHATQDEWRELYGALGGVDTHGNSIWKKWKSNHKEALDKPFEALSDSEIKELRMEVVDLWHFLLNISIALGMDAKMLFNYYQAKNIENKRRQKDGYK